MRIYLQISCKTTFRGFCYFVLDICIVRSAYIHGWSIWLWARFPQSGVNFIVRLFKNRLIINLYREISHTIGQSIQRRINKNQDLVSSISYVEVSKNHFLTFKRVFLKSINFVYALLSAGSTIFLYERIWREFSCSDCKQSKVPIVAFVFSLDSDQKFCGALATYRRPRNSNDDDSPYKTPETDGCLWEISCNFARVEETIVQKSRAAIVYISKLPLCLKEIAMTHAKDYRMDYRLRAATVDLHIWNLDRAQRWGDLATSQFRSIETMESI